ncbi:leucine-rich repeat domain, L domain-like protein [Artemisia annua]|uniref:Leucine-rich repeat domain, L domain-like protein n=1 Tax=Artemisia annua TaxID=35608 RepID=A0A2U1L0N4_ARTAN|nr:leucine-rich repeat domain, L domain-like protein [Artemisia annua]
MGDSAKYFGLAANISISILYVESLIIEKSSGLRSLRVEGVAKLVSLSVVDCDDLKSVNVKALELESLRFCGSLCSFSLQNVMYLGDAKLDFDVFGPLLFTKHNEQHFRFSRLQELWWIDSSMEDDNINSLFCFLKFCTSLKRLFVTIDPRSNSKPCANHQSSTMIQKGRLRKLKVVKLEGFENEVDIILFNEHLMEVFSVEPLVVEMRQGMQSRGLVRIPKRKARESDKLKSDTDKDYISKLPDEILIKILTIHRLDSGSKTVALLTGLWNKPWIIKHEGTTSKSEFENVITKFIENFDAKNPLDTPRRLEYHFNEGLILTATIGLKSKLHLDFSKGNQVFSERFVWDIVFKEGPLNTFDIKTLKLTSVNSSIYGFVFPLITKFRIVDNLIIEKCNGLVITNVLPSVKLNTLSIRDCVTLNSVFVEGSVLKSLRCSSGSLGWFRCTKESDLDDVMLDFKLGPRFNGVNERINSKVLKSIQNVKVLTLHAWMYKYLFETWNFEQDFTLSKLEDLWWIDSCMEDDNINLLSCFLKYCTSLKRLFITIDQRNYSLPKPFLMNCQSSRKVGKRQLWTLKVVKLEGVDEVDIMLFNEHLINVFDVEPRVLDVREGIHRCLIRIPKRQSIGRPRNSNKLKFCYRFVEEIEDRYIGLSSKHLHMR